MRKTRPARSRIALGLFALLTAISSVAGAYHQHFSLEGPKTLSVAAQPSDSTPGGPCLVCRAAREQAPALEAPDCAGPVLDVVPLAAAPAVPRAETPAADSASPRAPPASSETVSL